MKNVENILLLLALVVTTSVLGISLYFRIKYSLHMMQLEEYKNKNFKNWLKEFGYKIYHKKINMALISIIGMTIVYILMINVTEEVSLWGAFIGIWTILMLNSINFKKEKVKKELVYTPRVKRLFISNVVVNLIELAIIVVCYLTLGKEYVLYYPIVLALTTIVYHQVPYNMLLANKLVEPIEKRVNKYYFDMAYNKVREYKELKIVGITGSYGKTSTKFITTDVLQSSFNVLKTPESYNTPMGISKVINNTLNDKHEVFVVEMGARKIGEIEEVAKLVGPQIGVLTSIGPTHMDTYKTIENIMKTKYELIDELPTEGIAIFNYDNEYVKKLADKTFKEKILYGMDNVNELDIYAIDIEVVEMGSTFTLKDREGNEVRCKTKLLGKHNISNLLAGASVGKALGLKLEEIAKGIEQVEPIPHRLQLINPGTGVIVIDDAFNSNPAGAKAALDVLGEFKEGKKIIITPGMVELGDQEEEANEEFGRNIANICDVAILVGANRTKPIRKGILEAGFNENNLYVVQKLDEATQLLQKIVKSKDVVLFENDLPDTYNE